MFTPMRDASICVSNESAYYNNDRETALQNELNTSQVMMQSVNNDQLDFERGQHIPAFSFFGKVDYMANNAESKKSVNSVSGLARKTAVGGDINEAPLPTFNGMQGDQIDEGCLYFLEEKRVS